jgi:hypothetical protein
VSDHADWAATKSGAGTAKPFEKLFFFMIQGLATSFKAQSMSNFAHEPGNGGGIVRPCASAVTIAALSHSPERGLNHCAR